MEHEKYPSGVFLLKNNAATATTITTQDVVTDSDYNSDVPVHLSIPDQNQSGACSFLASSETTQQTVVNPDDILRNGILVETNKG